MRTNSAAPGAIEQALENREFVHFYQPIVDLADGTINAVESLIRWQHPRLGLLGPIQFLAQIQQRGLSKELTTVTLENVRRDLPALAKAYGPGVNVGVNLSGDQLGDPRTLDVFDAAIQAGDIDPKAIVVEAVEDLGGEQLALSQQTITGLRDRSIRVVLDDFGTGAGTLSLLTDLTYDGLKIDRHFVSRIRDTRPARSVVEVMLSFSRTNNIVVVAEGVEDESILRELKAMGCRYAQGYHLGRPAPADQLMRPTPKRATVDTSGDENDADLQGWREEIERRVPLLPNVDEAALVELIEPLDAELATLAATPRHELLVDLGFRKMLAALYGGCNALAMEWGMQTSRLAEDQGLPGRSAMILSVVAGITPDPKIEHPPSAEALARAITLRLSTDLTATEQTTVDNNLGTTLMNYGLIEHARGWCESALRSGQDCRARSLAALNLAEISLGRLSGAPWAPPAASNEFDRHTVDTARAVLRSSEFTPTGLVQAIEARCAILDGDLEHARALLHESALEPDAVGAFSVGVGRTLLAEASEQNADFLALSDELLKSVEHNHALRFQAVRARWIRVRALGVNGHFDTAYELQKAMTIEERDHASRHLTNFFDWMRLVVDVDRRYSELADLAAPAES